MNQDLEKLVDYALSDGYISDKEKQVLFKKAEAQGFDVDELELILEGRLNEAKKSTRPAINKCPNCGETISGISKVCPSCDYVLNSAPLKDDETLTESLKRLEESIYALKAVPNPGASRVISSAVFTVCSAGLYIIYVKLIKKENLFDRYSGINNKAEPLIDRQLLSLKQKYGEDEKINKYLIQLDAERKAIIKKRLNADAVSAVFIFVIIGIVIYALTLLSSIKPSVKVESAEDKTERLIKEKHINRAKIVSDSIEPGTKKDELQAEIRIMEIDSLTTAGNYSMALSLARLIKNNYLHDNEMESKIDEIIEKQVNDLIEKKEFEKAKNQAELASYTKKEYLLTSVKVAEFLHEDTKPKKATASEKKIKRKRKIK
ncbi:hypothetical protein Q765_17335 [Flavobacterium rivuli WB 3.3-2 = DSM 21788]|uniref:Uncharacterized protein n=1 Tax=Flavobacterium rivuli WB 3.3-2 = DSM 21788 TaxID=1121895 RepID=A0A0A2M0Y9_9FLAO|nr:zinc ribbon domain-containing protein [Flavobacterium rivuli]KGO85256.1 hypothetical protein Q765_17335 [Flavobacterium rivuli WB 3.3-2 = DSM 21788]